jgi:xanthine permease
LALAFFTLLVVIISNRFFTGFLQAISVLIGLVAGTVAAGFLGMLNFAEVGNAGWFKIITPFYYGMPHFRLDAIILLVIISIITSIEALGTFLGLSQICDHELSEKDIVRGLRAEGISKIMGGMFNSFPYATFSQNVGLVALSGVRSRFVTVMAGAILMVLGLVPKIAAIATVIPVPVLGGATLAMFGMVAVAGMRILFNVDLSKVGNMLIVAVSIGVGLGFNGASNVIGQLPAFLQTLLGDGIISASVLAIILNIVFNFKELSTSQLHVSTDEHVV